MTKAPIRVLAVCMGNICRSPTAEAAILEAARDVGLHIEVDSAGTGAWHEGEPPDARMTRAAAEVGLHLNGAARQFDPSDFDRFDLILAMDTNNHQNVVAMAPNRAAAEKVQMFRSYDPAAEDLDVPDPYYGGEQGFHDVVAMVRAAAGGLVRSLL